MGCCIALALLISVLRTGWFRLVRRQAPPRAGFAPPARRTISVSVTSARSTLEWSRSARHHAGVGLGEERDTAPDASLDAESGAAPKTAPEPAPETVSRRRLAAVGVIALSALVGAGLYSELLAVLVHIGPVTVDRAGWRVRELALIGGGVAAALVAVTAGLHRARPAERRRRLALALAGGGGAWALLSVVDMHVTGLVPEGLVDPLTDLALHGPGFLAATTGVGALLAGDRWLNSLSPSTTRGTS